MRLLDSEYGDLSWSPHHDPISELILIILSQNTADHNSRRAFSNLLARFGDLYEVANADVEEIVRAIKIGGLANVKAPRIKEILIQILVEKKSLDLRFLEQLSIDEARSWLLKLPGVGPKTAACVLLFSLGKPVLPVDTHVHRVAKRLALVGSQVSAEKAHQILGKMVNEQDVYRFHMHIITHGRRICRSHNPYCDRCILFNVCPSGQSVISGKL